MATIYKKLKWVMYMIFETERLILRPWEEGDAEELYKYVMKMLKRMSWRLAIGLECLIGGKA